MTSYPAIIAYVAVLLALLFAVVYLVITPAGAANGYARLRTSSAEPYAPLHIPHHPLAEHANILSTNYFNSFPTLNRIFSPLSVAYALAIIQAAGEGATSQELSAVLGGEYTMDELRAILELFHKQSSVVMEIITYWSVNANHTLNAQFVNSTHGLAMVSSDDYGDQMRVIHRINQIFAERTHNHINTAAKAIRPSTSSVLINAFYFQTYWKDAFDPRLNRVANFTQHVGTQKQVTLMTRVGRFAYFAGSGRQLLEIPYNVSDYVMGVLLEHTDQPLLATKPHFNLTVLLGDIARLRTTEVELHMPKFKHKRMLRAHVNLRAMGVKTVFDRKVAALPALGEGVHLTEMIHETLLIADELGSNSDKAALSAYLSHQRAMPAPAAPAAAVMSSSRMVMRLDRSFVYYVRHLPTNALVLLADFDHPGW